LQLWNKKEIFLFKKKIEPSKFSKLLHFEDRSTRNNDKLGSIRAVFETWNQYLQGKYIPGL
jgi:hypothetical protein